MVAKRREGKRREDLWLPKWPKWREEEREKKREEKMIEVHIGGYMAAKIKKYNYN